MAQTSLAWLARPSSFSCAIYGSVPAALVPVPPARASRARAIPKSISRTAPPTSRCRGINSARSIVQCPAAHLPLHPVPVLQQTRKRRRSQRARKDRFRGVRLQQRHHLGEKLLIARGGLPQIQLAAPGVHLDRGAENMFHAIPPIRCHG